MGKADLTQSREGAQEDEARQIASIVATADRLARRMGGQFVLFDAPACLCGFAASREAKDSPSTSSGRTGVEGRAA